MGYPRHPTDRGRLPGTWNHDPIVVDGYRPDGLKWPVETTRFAYMTPFAGFSADLAPGTIGLNRQALTENTELVDGDQVTLSVFERGRPVPLLARPVFEIVSVDFGTPDAFLRSLEGEALLSADDTRQRLPGLERLESGIRLIVNGVIAARLRAGPSASGAGGPLRGDDD
jgi:hypothetical protein